MQPLAHEVQEPTRVGSISPLGMLAATMGPEFDQLLIAFGLPRDNDGFGRRHGQGFSFGFSRMPDNVFYQALFRTYIRHKLDTFQAYLGQKSDSFQTLLGQFLNTNRQFAGTNQAVPERRR